MQIHVSLPPQYFLPSLSSKKKFTILLYITFIKLFEDDNKSVFENFFQEHSVELVARKRGEFYISES
jgi:hypothetical protein